MRCSAVLGLLWLLDHVSGSSCYVIFLLFFLLGLSDLSERYLPE